MDNEALVEAVARVMMIASRPNANPDDLTPAPRGVAGFVPKWHLFADLARAIIPLIEAERQASFRAGELAMRDRAADEDMLTDAIMDSLDMDWCASWGGRYASEAILALEPAGGEHGAD